MVCRECSRRGQEALVTSGRIVTSPLPKLTIAATLPYVKRRDPLDVDLVDEELLNEVDLLVRLVAAAQLSSGPLDHTELDGILGGREPRQPPPSR